MGKEITGNEIEQYIAAALKAPEMNPLKNLTGGDALKAALMILGALWGVPWIQPSYNAATIFPSEGAQEVIGNFFSAGIVITVGADGLWVMIEIIKK